MNNRSSTLHGKDQRALHICHPKDRRNVTNPDSKLARSAFILLQIFGRGGRPACMCLFFFRLRFLYIILYQRIDKPSMYKKRNTGRTPAGSFSDDQHPHDHFTVFLLPWHSITTQQERPAAADPKFYQAQDAPIMINKMNNTTSKAKPPP